jgi:hypothetical protein
MQVWSLQFHISLTLLNFYTALSSWTKQPVSWYPYINYLSFLPHVPAHLPAAELATLVTLVSPFGLGVSQT